MVNKLLIYFQFIDNHLFFNYICTIENLKCLEKQ